MASPPFSTLKQHSHTYLLFYGAFLTLRPFADLRTRKYTAWWSALPLPGAPLFITNYIYNFQYIDIDYYVFFAKIPYSVRKNCPQMDVLAYIYVIAPKNWTRCFNIIRHDFQIFEKCNLCLNNGAKTFRQRTLLGRTQFCNWKHLHILSDLAIPDEVTLRKLCAT
jgi:hypothetical protein